ncbi:hypothetical protein [Cohnella thermotolerans]|uniref:hypothetical protein n=1 Tax=Cohnella thermotolerans TaxID=329858 RepID=UPI00041ECA5A|nr:hypothetical protein [Cohnella thermotolerans]
MKSKRWLHLLAAIALAFAPAGLLRPQTAAAAGISWPAGQVLPSFSSPAGTLDVMDVTTEYKYEAEGSQVAHRTGHPDGNGWQAQTSIDAPDDFLVYGPYATDIPTGPNIAFYDLSIDNNTANNSVMVTVDVRDNTTGTVLATRDITRQ